MVYILFHEVCFEISDVVDMRSSLHQVQNVSKLEEKFDFCGNEVSTGRMTNKPQQLKKNF